MNVMLLLSITFLGFSSFFFLLGIFLIGSKVVTLMDWSFFLFFGGEFNYSIIVDGYGLVFGSCVLFISGSVFLFSCGYMGAEFNKKRFSLLVVSFIVSMILLIFSGNLIGVLLGWDGLGLTSFLLVIYYQNPYSFGAGMITALTNRLGDIGLILSTGLLLDYGHWSFSFLNSVPLFVVYMVFLGALTKSAQYPFSSWLPMAMAAPTPVSALVHSSTLVTAGVFLLIRFYPILEFWGYSGLSVLLLLSSLTMVMAGLAAFFEVDLKKVIAYSTLSQLGVMMMSLGLGSPLLAFMHLLSHALFKALMFVCAGVFIHYHNHSQDFRLMGGLGYMFPVTQLGMVVSNLALCGFPFLSGFYSKDPIYEVSITGNFGLFCVFFMVLGLLLTSAYSFRSVSLSQLGEMNQSPSLCCLGNSVMFYTLPVYLLGLGAITWGSVLNWVLLPPVFLGNISFMYGVIPLVLFFSVGLCSWFWNSGLGLDMLPWSLNEGSLVFKEGLVSLFFLGHVSSQYMVKNVAYFGGRFVSVVDQGWVEWSSGYGGAKILSNHYIKFLQVINSGSIPLFFLVGIFSFCLVLFL